MKLDFIDCLDKTSVGRVSNTLPTLEPLIPLSPNGERKTPPGQTFGDTACHPERSEGSGSTDEEILRFAQNDSQDISQVMSP